MRVVKITEDSTIYNEDCFDVFPHIESGSVDMILTDIPYGEVNRESSGLRKLNRGSADVFNFNLEELVFECSRMCKGSIYIFCGTEQVSEIRKHMVVKGLSTRLIIWNKTNPSPMNGDKIWLSSIECCVYGKFGGAVFNEHCKGSVLNFPTQPSKLHPTQKPLKMFEYLIGVSSNKGDMILDSFMGSGTTGVACMHSDRRFIGIEKDTEFGYFNVAKNRILHEQQYHSMF